MRTSRTSRRWLARKPRLLRPCQNSRGLRSRREPDQTSPVAGINDLPPPKSPHRARQQSEHSREASFTLSREGVQKQKRQVSVWWSYK